MNDKPNVPAISRRGMLSVLAAAAYTTSQSKSARGAPQPGEAPDTHKWMLVGSQTAFLSHLPMFEMLNPAKTEYMTPHRYQVILQASFNSGEQGRHAAVFRGPAKSSGRSRCTRSPRKACSCFRSSPHRPRLTSFQATVFRGHEERGGKPVKGLQSVAVNIQKVVHFHKFDPAAKAPGHSGVLAFRSRNGALSGAFDCETAGFRSAPVGERGWSEADRQRTRQRNPRLDSIEEKLPGDRLKEGEQAQAETSDGRKLSVRAVREFYFEEGELRIPFTFDTTPERKRAAFRDK